MTAHGRLFTAQLTTQLTTQLLFIIKQSCPSVQIKSKNDETDHKSKFSLDATALGATALDATALDATAQVQK